MRVLLVGGLGNDEAYFESFIRKCYMPVEFVGLKGDEHIRLKHKLVSSEDRELIIVAFSAGVDSVLQFVNVHPELVVKIREAIFVSPINLFYLIYNHNALAPHDPLFAPLKPKWWFDLRLIKLFARFFPSVFAWLYMAFNPSCPPSVKKNIFSDTINTANVICNNMFCSNPYRGLRRLQAASIPARFIISSSDEMKAYASLLREFDTARVLEYTCSHHMFSEEPELVANFLFKWSL